MKKTILLLSFITSFNAIYGQTWASSSKPDTVYMPKGVKEDYINDTPKVTLDTAALLKDGWELPKDYIHFEYGDISPVYETYWDSDITKMTTTIRDSAGEETMVITSDGEMNIYDTIGTIKVLLQLINSNQKNNDQVYKELNDQIDRCEKRNDDLYKGAAILFHYVDNKYSHKAITEFMKCLNHPNGNKHTKK